MGNRYFVIVLTSILVITTAGLISSNGLQSTGNIEFTFVKNAFAQSASGADNSSDIGISTNDPLAGLGLDNSTNSTSSTNTTMPSTSMSNSSMSQNQMQSATTPEFGSIAPIILVVSIISIVVISARNRLGFN